RPAYCPICDKATATSRSPGSSSEGAAPKCCPALRAGQFFWLRCHLATRLALAQTRHYVLANGPAGSISEVADWHLWLPPALTKRRFRIYTAGHVVSVTG